VLRSHHNGAYRTFNRSGFRRCAFAGVVVYDMRLRHLVALPCAVVALVFIAAMGAGLPRAGAPPSVGISINRIAPDRFEIVKLGPGSPSGAQVGDILDTRALTVEQRSRFWNGEAPAGETVPVTLLRGGQPVIVYAHLQALDPETQVAVDISFALMCFGVLGGLLLMLRGQGKASFAAGLMLLTLGLSSQSSWLGPTWLNLALFEVRLWSAPAFAISAFVLGMLLLRDRVSTPIRVLLILATSLAIAAEAFAWSFDYGLWMFTGRTMGGQIVYPYAAVAWVLVTILTFALAAARSQGASAAAVRTLFVATLIGLGEIAYTILSNVVGIPRPPALVSAACQLVMFAGYFYAFFARRLVALDFVLNRAAVFTIVAGVIAGALVLVEKLVEMFAFGRGLVFAVDLAATLLVALSFRWLESRISAAVEQVFYRAKLRAAEALDALPEDFPFHRDRAELANHLVREVQRQLQVPLAALYFVKGHEYVAGGAVGANLFSLPPVSDTDPAIIRLRSRHGPIDCHDFQTQLGSNGYAFPLVVLGRVTGCLYVAARTNGEAFDPDERSLLAHLAREAATAFLWMTEHKTAAADEAYSS
jgi:hypothetical protein